MLITQKDIEKLRKIKAKAKLKYGGISRSRLKRIEKSMARKKQRHEIRAKRKARKARAKIRKRRIKAAWELNNKLRRYLRMLSPDKQKIFLKYFGKYLLKERTYTKFELDVLRGAKYQKFLKSKRFNVLKQYKWKKLDRRTKPKFTDFFTQRKLQKPGHNCFKLNWHSQNVYALKRVLRFFYGYVGNNIFKKAFYKAKRRKNSSLVFLNYLENRLVITLYRMRFALNLQQSKQLIRHGAVYVNKKKIIYCNYRLKKNDVVSIDKKVFYRLLLRGVLDYRILNARIVPEMPNLYVRHRTLHGIYLYDIEQNYAALSKKYPEYFFHKSELTDEDFSLTKLSRGFDSYIKFKQRQMEDKKRKASPFMPHYYKLFEQDNERLPLRNVRLVLSFFLKN